MAKAQKPTKVVIDMEMPVRCGKCKLVMKTTNGDNFCLITRRSVGADYKHLDCPLTLYKSPTKSKALSPCNICNGSRRQKHVEVIDNETYIWYQCKKCGNGAQLSRKAVTLYGAKKAWNDLNK